MAGSAAPLATVLLAAARLVAAVLAGRSLDAALAAAKLPPDLRPAAMDGAYGALRRYGRGDFWLARLLSRPLAHAESRALLLVALYRLAERPGDAHTTVDQAVSAAARLAGGRYKGLVNAVLRNALRRGEEISAAAGEDPVARWQLPAWWLARLQDGFPDDWRAIAASAGERPPMTLRVNRRRTTAVAALGELAGAGIAARPLGDGALRLERPLPVEALPGFAAGCLSVQDFGAQRAAALLDARPGQRVLDACAAPGGKTAHLLELADLELTALDADAARARRIDENLVRLGLAATVRVADCRRLADWWDGRPYARILADVPCSASGVVRRHPDAKWLRREGDIAAFARQQAEIIEVLWQALAPGGKMLYATCSLFREENGAQVAAFVARHPDARRLPTGGDDNEWQLVPDRDQDGFYYALLEKR